VFSQFQEGKINFPPTYKYLPGTQDFETKKMRVPSWCDRILFRAPDEGLNQLFYTSVTKFVFSDHKPVTSLFEAKIRKTDPVAKQEVQKKILENLESLKDQVNPTAAFSDAKLHFKDLKYQEE